MCFQICIGARKGLWFEDYCLLCGRHGYYPSTCASRIFVPEESEEYERNLENSGLRYLNFCVELAHQKQMYIETSIRRGSVSGEIVKYSMEIDADIIVLGGNPVDVLYRDAIADSNHEVLKMPDALCSLSSRP